MTPELWAQIVKAQGPTQQMYGMLLENIPAVTKIVENDAVQAHIQVVVEAD